MYVCTCMYVCIYVHVRICTCVTYGWDEGCKKGLKLRQLKTNEGLDTHLSIFLLPSLGIAL